MLENRLRSFGPGTSVSTIRAVEAQLQSARAKFKGLALDAAQAGASLEMNIRKGANGAIAAINDLQQKLTDPIQGLTQLAGVAGLGMFLNNVTKIRGQFQLMETNINTLLGGAEKGQAMMAELTEYAKVSPLDFQGTVGAAQMMLGFGIDQQKIIPFMKALGDVSMGDAQRFQSLTLAFSQMSAAGKLMGQDLMQMVNAGFQPLDQLAKDTGKSIGQLKEEMSQGKISAEMVQQAFINATSEGGKFYNMSQAATATITGQMSMLGDATDLMFNDLGKKSEDAIIKVIEGATWMVENYEKVGGVLGTAIATFGIYKASAMASEFAIKVAAEERSKAVVQGFEEEIAKMEEYQRQQALLSFDDDIRNALETGSISDEMAKKVQALREETGLRKESAQAAVDAARAEQAAINDALKAANEKVDKAQEMVDVANEIGTAEEQAAAANELLSAQMEREALTTQLANSQTKVHNAEMALDAATTQANTLSQTQQTAATNANTAAQNANTVATGRGRIATALSTAGNKIATVAQYAYTTAINACTKAWHSMKVAFATNPIGLIITALTTVIGLFMTFKKETENATQVVERFGEAAVKTKRNVDTLYAVLDSVNKESKVYRDSLSELTKIAKDYGIVIDSEKDTLDQLIEKRGILNDLILKEGEARQIANRIATYQEDKKGYIDDFIKNMTESIADESKGKAEDNAGRFAQMIADKVERDLQDREKGILKGLITRWNNLENELKDLQTNIEYDDNGKVSEEWKKKKDATVQGIKDVQNQIAQTANSEAKAIAKEMGMIDDYKLNIKDTAKFVKELTDKIITTDKFLDAMGKRGQAVNQELESMKAPEPDFSAVGMDVTNLVKNFKDFKKQLDNINETDVSPKVDSSDIDKATESASEAKTEVENLDSSSATPSTDTAQIDAATDSAKTAAGAMAALDKTSAEPVIKTKWLDGFTTKVNEAWVGLQKFLGVDNPEPLIKSNQGTSAQQKTPSQKAQQAVTDIKAVFSKKIASAKTTNQMAEIRKGINELMGDLEQNSADYKYFEGLLKTLDKRDKSKNNKKSGSKDDPKQRAYELRKTQLEEEKRTAELLQAERNRQRELEIAQMEDNSEKEIATIKFTSEKKRQALENELKKEAATLEKNAVQEWMKGGKNRKEYQYYDQYSEAQIAEMRKQYQEQARGNIGYETQLSLIANNEATELQKIHEADMSAMRDYLKEYGTFQQKKLAIAEEYAEKIRKVQNKGEELTLIAQRDTELRNLESKAMTSQIDWYSVFDNVGVIMRGQLEPLYKQLQEYVKSDAFRKSGADNQQTVINAMDKIRTQLGTNDSWKDLSSALADYQAALNELRVATENDARVSEELAKLTEAKNTADANLERARTNADTTPEQMKEYTEAVEAAQLALENYSSTVVANNQAMQEAQNQVQSSGTLLSMTAKNVMQPVSEIYTFLSGAGLSQLAELWGAFDELKGGIDGLKSLKDIGKDTKELNDGMAEAGAALAKELPAELTEGLSKAGIIGQIIAAVLKILDILKDGIGTLISSILDLIFNAISGIIDNILSGEIFRQIGESLYKGILGIFKSIFTMGGLFDWIGNGESDKNLEKDIERLTATNEALRKAVDNLASEMKDAATADMGALYKQQKSNLEQSMKNTQEMMSRAGSAWTNGFLGIGGHKSSNHKIDNGMSGSEWSRISQIVGKSVRSADDFWNLTSEQMAKIAQNAPDLYAKIKGLADDGYKDAAQFMDEYIEYYKELEELESAFRESLTDVSFDSVKDDFKSLLLDMESDSKDFASNWEKMMQQAVINSLMNSKYNDLLKKWYNGFADAMNDDNGLTEAEQAKLKQEWDSIVNSAIAERDSIKKAMGWDTGSAYSQEASKAGVTTVTEDTGLAIVGRMTAMQEAVESIKGYESISALTLADMTDELIQIAMEYSRFNVHQDNIERQLAKIYIELQTISENTGAIVKPIYSMQESLHRIEQHTKNL